MLFFLLILTYPSLIPRLSPQKCLRTRLTYSPSFFLLTPPPPFLYNVLGMNTNVAQFPLT